MVGQAQEVLWRSVSSFSVGAAHTRVFISVRTDKTSKGPMSTHCWVVISRTRCLWKYTNIEYFRCFGVRNSILKAAEAF